MSSHKFIPDDYEEPTRPPRTMAEIAKEMEDERILEEFSTILAMKRAGMQDPDYIIAQRELDDFMRPVVVYVVEPPEQFTKKFKKKPTNKETPTS